MEVVAAVSTAAVAVELSVTAAEEEDIVEAAPMEAHELSEEEVLTKAEAFAADRTRVTAPAGVRTADSTHRAA